MRPLSQQRPGKAKFSRPESSADWFPILLVRQRVAHQYSRLDAHRSFDVLLHSGFVGIQPPWIDLDFSDLTVLS